jgi:hypothetical protein
MRRWGGVRVLDPAAARRVSGHRREVAQKFAYIRRGDVMVEVPGQLSQYFFNAVVKVLKFAAGQEVGELSRTSQCM